MSGSNTAPAKTAPDAPERVLVEHWRDPPIMPCDKAKHEPPLKKGQR